MVRVVWTQLISFDLQPQIHKNYNGAHIKGMHRVMLKYSHVLRAELVSIAEQYTKQNTEQNTETGPPAYWCPAILSFQTGMDATLHA